MMNAGLTLTIDDHPLLDLGAFVTVFPQPLGQMHGVQSVLSLLRTDASAPMSSNDEVRSAVRNLLRQGGFKPTGRSKPASEYLIKAADQGGLSSINIAVDTCNAVSLHSGLPISVVDVDLVTPPLRIGIAAAESAYVFNQAGQTIDVTGLLCLLDAHGPCANAVKDAQRTKTRPETLRTLSLVWGTAALPGRAAQTRDWYTQLLQSSGAAVEPCFPV